MRSPGLCRRGTALTPYESQTNPLEAWRKHFKRLRVFRRLGVGGLHERSDKASSNPVSWKLPVTRPIVESTEPAGPAFPVPSDYSEVFLPRLLCRLDKNRPALV